jgi:hypothetical protein
MRVTDLEKFALEQIWRPYQGAKGSMCDYEPRLERLPKSLEETAAQLLTDTEWSRCVVGRLAGIGITFPSYISHPLATIVTFLIRRHRDRIDQEKKNADK